MRVAVAHRHVCRLGLAQRTSAPLAHQLLAHAPQHGMQVVVAEALAAAVGIEGAVVPQQVVGLPRLGDGVLLVDAYVHILALRLSDLDPAGKRRVVVHVDLRHRTPHLGKYLFCCLHKCLSMSRCRISPPTPLQPLSISTPKFFGQRMAWGWRGVGGAQ